MIAAGCWEARCRLVCCVCDEAAARPRLQCRPEQSPWPFRHGILSASLTRASPVLPASIQLSPGSICPTSTVCVLAGCNSHRHNHFRRKAPRLNCTRGMHYSRKLSALEHQCWTSFFQPIKADVGRHVNVNQCRHKSPSHSIARASCLLMSGYAEQTLAINTAVRGIFFIFLQLYQIAQPQ